ncbi:hypothetical protein YC2023_057925 [Brassica napus]
MATLETCLATTKEIRNHIRDLELPDSLDKTYKTGPDEVVQVAGRACGGNHHPGSIPPPCGNYPASSGHQSGTRFDQAQSHNWSFLFGNVDVSIAFLHNNASRNPSFLRLSPLLLLHCFGSYRRTCQKRGGETIVQGAKDTDCQRKSSRSNDKRSRRRYSGGPCHQQLNFQYNHPLAMIIVRTGACGPAEINLRTMPNTVKSLGSNPAH